MSSSTRSSKKRKSTAKKRKSQGEEKPEDKRRRLGGNLGPDVVLVIGAKEFHENSHILRSFSDYFDAAFRSGMKESQEMTFEFPDKDPDEWEFVKELLMPLPTKKITTKNIKIVLPWFDELIITRGLDACGRMLRVDGSGKRFDLCMFPEATGERQKKDVQILLDSLLTSAKYNLLDAKESLIVYTGDILKNRKDLFDHSHLELLEEVLQTDEESRNALF